MEIFNKKIDNSFLVNSIQKHLIVVAPKKNTFKTLRPKVDDGVNGLFNFETSVNIIA